MVVSTLRPLRAAHRLAPLPRCAITVRPRAATAVQFGQAADDVFVGQAVKAVASDPLASHGGGRARRWALAGMVR